MDVSLGKIKIFILSISIGFSYSAISVAAEQLATPTMCEDLARFSCAPGSYKDGTGEIKSAAQMEKLKNTYVASSGTFLKAKFENAISGTNGRYFRKLAIASVGLDSSPSCTSAEETQIKECDEALVDGLILIAQRQALAPFMSQALKRIGNLRDLDFLLANPKFTEVVAEMNSKLRSDFDQPETERKIHDTMLPEIKELIAQRLKELPIEDAKRQLMIDKIRGIEFAGTKCSGSSTEDGSNKVISSLIVSNANYSQRANTFRLCSGYLMQSSSEFQMITSMVHELSHSIDPCGITKGPGGLAMSYSRPNDIDACADEYPIKELVNCLRDERSVGAKNFGPGISGGDPEEEPATGTGAASNLPIPNGYAGFSGMSTGGGMYPTQLSSSAIIGPKNMARVPKSFCDSDQIGESFSDWMAAEILPRYMEKNHKLTVEQYRNGYGNARRLICKIEDGNDSFDVHPKAELRINRIILANPKIRSQMGCPPLPASKLYCDPNVPYRATASGNAVDPASKKETAKRGVSK